MEDVIGYELTKKGLTIHHSLLERAGLESDLDVFAKDHTIIIKSRSMTDRVRGIVKKTPLTVEKLDELYHTSKGV
ncbi:MAG: hypothetical protein MPEBLZ_01873 [Candidatus Methanoperedens nitroreducens]|uniref:Uncharacterized protein n=1 Tax=Candidatus Methanoperedens nitratireducens TaxID=1392998 RepID=A0A0P8AAP2_9EURY|nr:hypothetical protein [Candidatus Methanoperedens sp. BLZ2]KAB2948389.1 MAG: hypothetical protein F9K14_00725 [Candidatus Methanoperedens sp.]KPQ43686.1 MAG: hypothetical protein MPEBLZ_01873 [Candidatus Methanoperedens sp. BLZ1]MBZ0174524.1 hypothetical protein [Candidatus Methanoperedens nitroreducens]CAG0957649.1 hypothetical protein METP2_00594 [Methanosarcinales archaeon]MCX9078548.1 hypothetical protein [Candidatus Methanoperedens sp.]